MTTTNKTLQHYLSLASEFLKDMTFTEEFNSIIADKIEGYEGSTKDKLKSFFNDLQHGGCQSGMIGDFIYNNDCKQFYIRHIDDLEAMKLDLEDQTGEAIRNEKDLPHYTFMCWLCFEEYCYDLYRTIFEN